MLIGLLHPGPLYQTSAKENVPGPFCPQLVGVRDEAYRMFTETELKRGDATHVLRVDGWLLS